MPRKALCALAVSVAVVGSIAMVGPSAAAADPPGQPAGSPEVHARHAVTLITGDRVVLIEREGGERQVTVERGPGREGVQLLQRTGKDSAGRDRLEVVPVDALRLVAAGRLDARLFDITALVRAGYDDRSRSEIPLIVSYRPGSPTAQHQTISGTTTHRVLSSVNGAALGAHKDQAAALLGVGHRLRRWGCDAATRADRRRRPDLARRAGPPARRGQQRPDRRAGGVAGRVHRQGRHGRRARQRVSTPPTPTSPAGRRGQGLHRGSGSAGDRVGHGTHVASHHRRLGRRVGAGGTGAWRRTRSCSSARSAATRSCDESADHSPAWSGRPARAPRSST